MDCGLGVRLQDYDNDIRLGRPSVAAEPDIELYSHNTVCYRKSPDRDWTRIQAHEGELFDSASAGSSFANRPQRCASFVVGPRHLGSIDHTETVFSLQTRVSV